MKKYLYISFLVLLNPLLGYSQQTITLTFTAIDSSSYVQLDKIKVMNRTQGGDTTLYWNDTVLVLNLSVGLPEINSIEKDFILRSFPNPVTEQSTIELSVPEQGKITLSVTDIIGRSLFSLDRELKAGLHTFDFIPGNAPLYFITVTWKGYHKTIKIMNSTSNPERECTISYQGYDEVVAQEKESESRSGFVFNLGDELLHKGYVDTLESGILDIPYESQAYTFQFAYDIPCPGIPTVTYEGQVYNTIQIFSQCWLKENLNVGTMIPGVSNMQDNDILEKYCYDDDTANCSIYGGLYQWDEMMQYRTGQAAQGICPPGWHIPTDEEWKILEGAADSYYPIGAGEWDREWAWRGSDAGNHLKTTSGWNVNIGTDKFGFSVLPGGDRYLDGEFYVLKSVGVFWTSNEYLSNTTQAWNRSIGYIHGQINRKYNNHKNYGFSVRCIKD